MGPIPGIFLVHRRTLNQKIMKTERGEDVGDLSELLIDSVGQEMLKRSVKLITQIDSVFDQDWILVLSEFR
jgi:hypothetical protein